MRRPHRVHSPTWISKRLTTGRRGDLHLELLINMVFFGVAAAVGMLVAAKVGAIFAEPREPLRDWLMAAIEVSDRGCCQCVGVRSWMALRINRDKTRVVRLNEPSVRLDFLRYTFGYDRDRLGRPHRYLNLFPSKKALERERQKLREMTGPKMCFKPIRVMIAQINRHLEGWSRYFDQGYPGDAFRQINRFVRERLTRHLKRRSQRPYRPPKGVTWYAQLDRLGLVYR